MKVAFCFAAQAYKKYIPLDIGYIVSYFYANANSFSNIEIEIINIDVDLDEKVLAEDLAQQGFKSCFFFLDNIVWSRNFYINFYKRVAPEFKKKSIFVGLQSYKISPQESANLFKEGWCDAVVHKSPEQSFLELASILKQEPVAGVSFPNVDSQDMPVPKLDLQKIPSPYTSGVLDKLIETYRDNNGSLDCTAYILTTRGCPYGCYYCYRSVKFEELSFFSAERVYDEIEYLFTKFGLRQIFILDDCFITHDERIDTLIQEFENRKKKIPSLEEIDLTIMTRPEMLNQKSVEKLKQLNVSHIQLGLQTIHPDLQEYMTRSSDVSIQFKSIAKWLQKEGISFQLDIIIGLPGDSLEWFKKTVDFAVSLSPSQLQIKQLYMNQDTKFYKEKEKYELDYSWTSKDETSVPFVSSAKGITEEYLHGAALYIMEQKSFYPEIFWNYLTKYENYYDGRYFLDEGVDKSKKHNLLKRYILEQAWVQGDQETVISKNGSKSKWIMDLRRIFLNPESLDMIAEVFWERMRMFGKFQLGGQELSSVPLITAIALKAKQNGVIINSFIIRKKRKAYGLGKQLEGVLTDDPVILVDDLMNSGQSLQTMCDIMKEKGKSVRAFLTLVDFESPVGASVIKKNKLIYKSLYTLSQLGIEYNVKADLFCDPRLLGKVDFQTGNFTHQSVKQNLVCLNNHIFYLTSQGDIAYINFSKKAKKYLYKTEFDNVPKESFGLQRSGEGIFWVFNRQYICRFDLKTKQIVFKKKAFIIEKFFVHKENLYLLGKNENGRTMFQIWNVDGDILFEEQNIQIHTFFLGENVFYLQSFGKYFVYDIENFKKQEREDIRGVIVKEAPGEFYTLKNHELYVDGQSQERAADLQDNTFFCDDKFFAVQDIQTRLFVYDKKTKELLRDDFLGVEISGPVQRDEQFLYFFSDYKVYTYNLELGEIVCINRLTEKILSCTLAEKSYIVTTVGDRVFLFAKPEVI